MFFTFRIEINISQYLTNSKPSLHFSAVSLSLCRFAFCLRYNFRRLLSSLPTFSIHTKTSASVRPVLQLCSMPSFYHTIVVISRLAPLFAEIRPLTHQLWELTYHSTQKTVDSRSVIETMQMKSMSRISQAAVIDAKKLWKICRDFAVVNSSNS